MIKALFKLGQNLIATYNSAVRNTRRACETIIAELGGEITFERNNAPQFVSSAFSSGYYLVEILKLNLVNDTLYATVYSDELGDTKSNVYLVCEPYTDYADILEHVLDKIKPENADED